MASEEPFEADYSIEDYFSYSYGRISRFFREIVENERLFGTECPDCGKVWCPPRAHCSDCLTETDWTPLPGTGEVMAAVDTYYVPGNHVSTDCFNLPFVIAMVKPDGADTTLWTMVVAEDEHEVTRGTRVEAVFREEREGYITDFWFRPTDGPG